MKGEKKSCTICFKDFDLPVDRTIFCEAGEWLSDEFWQDAGELCPQCLENRAKLAMMYLIDR